MKSRATLAVFATSLVLAAMGTAHSEQGDIRRIVTSAATSTTSVSPSAEIAARRRSAAKIKNWYMEEGLAYYQRGDYDNALFALKGARAKNPHDAELEDWIYQISFERDQVLATRTTFMFLNAQTKGRVELVTSDGRRYIGDDIGDVRIDNSARLLLGPLARAAVLLEDGSTYAFQGASTDTEVQIEPFIYDPQSDSTWFKLRFKQGQVHWLSAAERAERARLRPALIIPGVMYCGPRGTEFDITVDDSNSGYINVISGAVDYTFDAGATGTVTAGQTLRFRNGKPELFSVFH